MFERDLLRNQQTKLLFALNGGIRRVETKAASFCTHPLILAIIARCSNVITRSHLLFSLSFPMYSTGSTFKVLFLCKKGTPIVVVFLSYKMSVSRAKAPVIHTKREIVREAGYRRHQSSNDSRTRPSKVALTLVRCGLKACRLLRDYVISPYHVIARNGSDSKD